MEPTAPSEIAEQDILEARARALARPLRGEVVRGKPRDVLVFSVGPERFALETAFLRIVTRIGRMTPLPGALPHVRALVPVRGRALPLIDLGRLLNRDFEATHPRFAVILGLEHAIAALAADLVDEVTTVDLDARNDAAPPRTRFEIGIFPGPITLLKGPALISETSFEVSR